jgi:hypothetical protein
VKALNPYGTHVDGNHEWVLLKLELNIHPLQRVSFLKSFIRGI